MAMETRAYRHSSRRLSPNWQSSPPAAAAETKRAVRKPWSVIERRVPKFFAPMRMAQSSSRQMERPCDIAVLKAASVARFRFSEGFTTEARDTEFTEFPRRDSGSYVLL